MVLNAHHASIDATLMPQDCRKPISPAITVAVTGLRGSPDNCYGLVPTRIGDSLDIIVTPSDNGKAWDLTDLLGRSMGRIAEASDQQLAIYPAGQALTTMAGMSHGPYLSLDAALAAIEKHTRGVCRLCPGEDQP